MKEYLSLPKFQSFGWTTFFWDEWASTGKCWYSAIADHQKTKQKNPPPQNRTKTRALTRDVPICLCDIQFSKQTCCLSFYCLESTAVSHHFITCFPITVQTTFSFQDISRACLCLKPHLAGDLHSDLSCYHRNLGMGLRTWEHTDAPGRTLPHTATLHAIAWENLHADSVPMFPSTIVQESSFLAVILSPKCIYQGCTAYFLLLLSHEITPHPKLKPKKNK